ncbi:long-chain fatty acid--CoA ligase [Rossellomorea vietnamensis]|uniref:Long-chain fatty acid--CoA ligase n=1 Tax=Rossellomorea vietnamensis TaxID=218284 RepID=A0A5D4MCS1_9BACI|nr:long-chain fatty acid--CoA ligase [Rossellomorea vietnamensis]TYR99739.1 long-chain fatty acid--CoA ligase [Rossellomorea vietnamensis]
MSYEIDWVKSRSDLFPEKRAVIDSVTQDSWTYKELDERASRLAGLFLAQGVGKGDRIALFAENHISYFDFLFACLKIGAVFVPLNWRLSTEELQFVVSDAAPVIMGVLSCFIKQASGLQEDFYLIEVDSNHYLDQYPAADRLGGPLLQESDPLAMIYTGGTTGHPKGAVLSHRSIMWNAVNTIVSWNLTDRDTTMTCIPMFHTGGLNALSIPVLIAGGTVVLSPGFEPEQAVKDLIKYKCSIVLFVPTMYHMLTRTKEFKNAKFPDMKVFLSGGAPCPMGIYDIFSSKGLAFKEGYGLTEAGPNNFYIDPREALQRRGSVGKPMLFNAVKVVKETGDEAGPDEVGELYLRGSHLFEYYWNKEEETKEVWRDGWFQTGDLAMMDKAGYYYIVGRKKDMIITGGENVYPLEIENWLESYDSVEEVAVLGVPDDKWGEKVVAFITAGSSTGLTEEELANYCRKKLAKYKIPKNFYFIEELPKTHVGKIDKNELRKRLDKVT